MKTFSLLLSILLSSPVLARETLEVHCYTGEDRAIQAALPLWNKLHPDVEIKLTSQNYGDHHSDLHTALSTGKEAGDVNCIEVGFVAYLGKFGGLVDLTKAPYFARQYQSKITSYAWSQATNPDGGMDAFPIDIAPGTLFYRQDVLQKAGVTTSQLTKSWESYIEAGKKIKEKTGAYLLHDVRFIVRAYLQSTIPEGETLYFDAKGQPTLSSPRFVQAFTLAKKIHDLKLDADVQEWSPEWFSLLREGKLATLPFGSWFVGFMQQEIPETSGKWRVMDLPEKSNTTWGGSFLAISKQSEQKDLAWEFIHFMALNKEVQLNTLRTTGQLPALRSVQRDPLLSEPIKFLGGQMAGPMWVRVANKTPASVQHRFDVVADDLVYQTLNRVIKEGMDIKVALDQAQGVIFRPHPPRHR